MSGRRHRLRLQTLVRVAEDLGMVLCLGAFACSIVFDVRSQGTGDQFLYATGGLLLVSVGLASGAVAAVLGAARLAPLVRTSRAFRIGRAGLVALDLCLVWFAFCYLHRDPDPAIVVPLWMVAGSLVAVLVVAISRSIAVVDVRSTPSVLE